MKGKTVAQFDGKEINLSAKQLGGNSIEINTKGKGKLYYYWQSEGISTSGKYKEEDSFIKVRRQFFDRYGRRIDNNLFKQNDLVIVQLTLERLFNSEVENIVVTGYFACGI